MPVLEYNNNNNSLPARLGRSSRSQCAFWLSELTKKTRVSVSERLVAAVKRERINARTSSIIDMRARSIARKGCKTNFPLAQG